MLPEKAPTPYRKDGKKVYGMVYGGYDITLCSCREAYDFLKAHGVENVKHGAFLGIDDAMLEMQEKSRLVGDGEQVRILYAGRLEQEKDIHIVLNIFKELQKLHPGTVLYLAGKGEDLEAAVAAGRKNPAVKCLGYLEHKELAKLYNSVDIYFTPYAVETFGLTILESMAKGLPVVAADRGGAGNLVKDGVNGFACSSETAYVEALSRLVKNKALRRELGENGRSFAESYSAHSCACNLLKEYEALINLRGRNEKI
jgi:glycosyltransferase involved in cell wall biosynthesis